MSFQSPVRGRTPVRADCVRRSQPARFQTLDITAPRQRGLLNQHCVPSGMKIGVNIGWYAGRHTSQSSHSDLYEDIIATEFLIDRVQRLLDISYKMHRKLQCIELVLTGRTANLTLETIDFGNDAIPMIGRFALPRGIVRIII